MKTHSAAAWLALVSIVSGGSMDWPGESLEAPKTVFVTWESSLLTGNQIIFVKDNEGTSLLAYACDNKLTLGGVPIQVLADETANGEMMVGDARYALEFDVVRSGGIVCDARWNANFAAVECEIPWTVGTLNSLGRLDNITAECLGREAENDLVFVGEAYGDEDVFYPTVDEASDPGADSKSSPSARQCQWVTSTKLYKGGYPHKWRRNIQLTTNGNCGNGDCGSAFARQYSVTHQATFSLIGLDSLAWISGGYAVSFTHTTGEEFSCGGQAHQTICVDHWQRYLGYSVERTLYNTCAPVQNGGTIVKIRSPMTATWHQGFFCRRGGCVGKGHVWWQDGGAGTF